MSYSAILFINLAAAHVPVGSQCWVTPILRLIFFIVFLVEEEASKEAEEEEEADESQIQVVSELKRTKTITKPTRMDIY